MAAPGALALLEKHIALSADEDAQPAGMGHELDDRRRASLTGRPKLRLTLDPVPADWQCIRFDEEIYRTVAGADRFDEAVVFQDSIDRLIDAWPRSVTTVLESRWSTAVSAR